MLADKQKPSQLLKLCSGLLKLLLFFSRSSEGTKSRAADPADPAALIAEALKKKFAYRYRSDSQSEPEKVTPRAETKTQAEVVLVSMGLVSPVLGCGGAAVTPGPAHAWELATGLGSVMQFGRQREKFSSAGLCSLGVLILLLPNPGTLSAQNQI